MYRIRVNTIKGPSECSLYLPARVLDGLGLAQGDQREIQAGPRVTRVKVGMAPRSAIRLEIKHRLRLPSGVLRLHVARRGERLHLGPFLGILAQPQRTSPYGEQTAFFRRLIARAKAMHIYAFVFSPRDLAVVEGQVIGHRPHKNATTWVSRRCPIPDVVFDRGFFHGADVQKATKMRDLLVNDYGVKLFNTEIGNKWDVHQLLAAEPSLVPHLPETALADAPEVIDQLMARHHTVYVKPAAGNQGRNVFRVRPRRGKIYYQAHLRRGKLVRASVAQTSDLVTVLQATREKGPYVVQQGLDLVKVQGRQADIRALVQRDRQGEWRLTGVGVRVGGRSNVVSNLHAGGSAAKLAVMVPRPGRKAKSAELEARVREVALKVAQRLGEEALLGELGVDLGLDSDGRIWIIEVNLRPGRATFRRAGLTEAWRRSGRAPLEYALHLWGENTDADD